MREDMFKVIVERPRLVNSNSYSGDGRPYRNREDGPSHLGMKAGYDKRKWLNENLRPLQRFLEQQVGRPWDKVYSEIRATIDPRNTVKQHILQHLDNFVAIQTRWEADADGDQVLLKRWNGSYVGIAESDIELFVHPRTGILLRNRHYDSRAARRKRECDEHSKRQLALRRVISARVQLHCLDGIWYRVDLDELPPGREILRDNKGILCKEIVYDYRWDVVRQANLSRDHASKTQRKGECIDYKLFGQSTLYAVAKRQLGKRELQEYGLSESAQRKKAHPGLFLFWWRHYFTCIVGRYREVQIELPV